MHEKDERGKHYRGVQLGATELKKDGEHFGRWREGKEVMAVVDLKPICSGEVSYARRSWGSGMTK